LAKSVTGDAEKVAPATPPRRGRLDSTTWRR